MFCLEKCTSVRERSIQELTWPLYFFGEFCSLQKWCMSKYGSRLPPRLLIWLFASFLCEFQAVVLKCQESSWTWKNRAKRSASLQLRSDRCLTGCAAEQSFFHLLQELPAAFSALSLTGLSTPKAQDVIHGSQRSRLGCPFISSNFFELYVSMIVNELLSFRQTLSLHVARLYAQC